MKGPKKGQANSRDWYCTRPLNKKRRTQKNAIIGQNTEPCPEAPAKKSVNLEA
jgi:hypothetical protein